MCRISVKSWIGTHVRQHSKLYIYKIDLYCLDHAYWRPIATINSSMAIVCTIFFKTAIKYKVSLCKSWKVEVQKIEGNSVDIEKSSKRIIKYKVLFRTDVSKMDWSMCLVIWMMFLAWEIKYCDNKFYMKRYFSIDGEDWVNSELIAGFDSQR